jgi:hypothetical protein
MAEITIVMGKAKGHCCWPNYIACKQHFSAKHSSKRPVHQKIQAFKLVIT